MYDDLISRQAAMEEISKQQTYKMFEGEDTLYLDANDVGSVLASLPSAQPERRPPDNYIGEWIFHQDWKDDGECPYECNWCGRAFDYDMNYCGYCGAFMNRKAK